MGRKPIENLGRGDIRYRRISDISGSLVPILTLSIPKPKSTSLTFIPSALWPSAHYEDEWWQMSANYRDPVNIEGWRGTFCSLIVTLHLHYIQTSEKHSITLYISGQTRNQDVSSRYLFYSR